MIEVELNQLKWLEAITENHWITLRMIEARERAGFDQDTVRILADMKELPDYEQENQVWRIDHLYVLAELYQVDWLYITTGFTYLTYKESLSWMSRGLTR